MYEEEIARAKERGNFNEGEGKVIAGRKWRKGSRA